MIPEIYGPAPERWEWAKLGGRRGRAIQDYEAKLLGLASYNAGIELEQTTYDQNGQPFCFDRQIWRGELAEFAARAFATDPKN